MGWACMATAWAAGSIRSCPTCTAQPAAAGHLTILSIPFSLALAAGVAILLPWRNQRTPAQVRTTSLFLLLATAGAIGMAIVFTVGISPSDLGGLGRWHSRYYFSSFPCC